MIFIFKNKIWLFGVIFLAAGFCVFPIRAEGANLLITEVQIAGAKANYDFIEIYNAESSSLDISGYKLRKRTSTGSESSIRVFPVGSIINGKGYFLWANSEGGFDQSIGANISSTQTLAKNNSIALLNPEGNIIDALAWGENLVNPFVEGEKFSVNPEANQSLARKFLSGCGCYQDFNNNSVDFNISNNPTPGQQNSQSNESMSTSTSTPTPASTPTPTPTPTPMPTFTPTPSVTPASTSTPALTSTPELTPAVTFFPSPTPAPKPVYSRLVVINEFLPDPVGDDSQGEWIELFNEGNKPVDLAGWTLTNGKASKFTIPQNTVIGAKSFLVFSRPDTKLVINNSGEILSLIDPNGDLAFRVSYEGRASEGQTLARQQDGKWVWSNTPTPGRQNIIKIAGVSKPAPKSSPAELSSAPAREELTELAADENQILVQNAAIGGSPWRNYKIAGIAVLLGFFSVAGILILKKFLI